jgi:hypothetical protein
MKEEWPRTSVRMRCAKMECDLARATSASREAVPEMAMESGAL